MGKHHDWTEIQKEYEETDISYAQLAKKHEISLHTLKKAGARNGWVKSRELIQAQSIENAIEEAQTAPEENGAIETAPIETAPMVPNVIQLYPDKIMPAESDAVRFARLVDGMMNRVEDAICNVDVNNPGAIKLLTAALRDLRKLKHLDKTPLDIEEQKARIEKLKSETRIVEDTSDYGVIMLPPIEEVVPPE